MNSESNLAEIIRSFEADSVLEVFLIRSLVGRNVFIPDIEEPHLSRLL